MLTIVLLTFGTGIVGAITSNIAMRGGDWMWPFTATFLSAAIWAWTTKQPYNPWALSLVFDLAYTFSWFLTFTLLGNWPTAKQLLSLVFMLIGMVLAI
jgi:hypothetical protein